MIWIVSSLMIFCALPAPDTSRASTTTEQHREEASSLERKLREIKRHAETDDTGDRRSSITLTQSEINSYLKLSPAMRLPAGLSDVNLRLESGRIRLSARVDLERARNSFSTLPASHPVAFLSGELPVEIDGQLDCADGFGSVILGEIRLGPALVPAKVVGRFVRSITRTSRNPQGIDILSPFRLPYSIRKIRLKPGRAVLVF